MPEVAMAGRELLAITTARLSRAGCDTPRLDAELLLAHALAVTRERLLIDGADGVDSSAFEELVARREAREPIAYIVGHREFRRISLTVDRRVLIPRPETELLVEVGLGLPYGARVIDVGTGSGAVALALAEERPDLEIWASDISAGALEVAAQNARRLGSTVRLLEADLLEGVDHRFDAVLANLPYVSDRSQLAPDVALYEPPRALLAGADGLDAIRRLVRMAAGVALIALEVGYDQADAVAELLSGWRSVTRLRDLAGHERVLVGSRE